MATIDTLTPSGVQELAQRTDSLGVLSVFVDADAAHDPQLRAAGIGVQNRLRELQHRLGEERPADEWRRLRPALDRVRPLIEELTGPAVGGRGRILFAGLGDGWSTTVTVEMPVPERLVLGDGPFLHPLLELLDEGGPAGVLTVAADEAVLYEWRLGVLERLQAREPEYVQAPHERTGQIGGGPAGQYNTPRQEQRAARDRDRMRQFIDEVAAEAARLAAQRGWERVLVSGGTQWTEAAIAALPPELRETAVADGRVLSGLTESALGAQAGEALRAAHTAAERGLAKRVRDKLHAGTAVAGVAEVAAALNDGRVSQLIYDPEVRYIGAVGGDGALYADGQVMPGEEEWRPESRFTERLAARALQTGARVRPVEGVASDVLAEAEGIAAELRW